MRIGHGYDVHRLVENRKLIIGGVLIEYEKGLKGHSDADVLIHSLMDSILGAAGMGDIGTHYPDTDKQYKDISSRELLRHTINKVTLEGYKILNIDATVIAQAPKLAPYIKTMRENISQDCGMLYDDVNIKATTEEGLGFTGLGEGIAAHTVCLIEKSDKWV